MPDFERADSAYEIREYVEHRLRWFVKTFVAGLIETALQGSPEPLIRTTIVVIVDKQSGRRLRKFRGITYQIELDDLRSRLERDLQILAAGDFRVKYGIGVKPTFN